MASADDVLVVLVTAPTTDAPNLAQKLVERRVAACANVVDGVKSHFWWEGRVQEEEESLLILKTARDAFEALRDAVADLHPYDVPEVLALDVEQGLEAYTRWVIGEVRPRS